MDPNTVTPSESETPADMSMMIAMLFTAVAVTATTLWVCCRRRQGDGAAVWKGQDRTGSKDSEPSYNASPKLANLTDSEEEELDLEEDVEEKNGS